MKQFITAIGLVLIVIKTAAAREPSAPSAPGSARAPSAPAAERSFLPRPTAASALKPASATKPASAREQSLLARVTVYWASGGRGSDGYTRQHKSSTGLRLRPGHCAVDPRKIPYGSQIIFPDRTPLVAVDTGSAVRTRKAARQGGRTACEKSAIVVDRFFETKGQALAWARQNPAFMTVRVVPPIYRQQPLMQTRQGFEVARNTTPFAESATERKPPFRSTGLTSTPSVPATPTVQRSQVAAPAAQLIVSGSNAAGKPTFQSADLRGPLTGIPR
jgi:3D (Asp-Asp-Asp) domain-containing protein